MSSVWNRARADWSGAGVVARVLLAYARSIPAHPGKIRIFRRLSRIFCPAGLRVKDDCGVRLQLDPEDYIGHAICFTGSFEPISLGLAQRLMKEGGTFLDVGSNIGLYSCSLSRIPGVRCLAVDASARAFSRLLDNLALNPECEVTAVNVALGAHRGLAGLNAPNPGNLGTTRVSAPGARLDAAQNVVAVVPLYELLTAAGVTSIRLMKIDVEGFEFEVFRGMDLVGGVRPESILMEYSREVSNASALRSSFDLLESAGYQAHMVTGERFEPSGTLPEENLWWKRSSEGRSQQEPVA
jgi:FkbM family methyltransferase